MMAPKERLMQSVDQKAVCSPGAHRADSPGLGMLMTLPIAALLWLMIIAAAFELFKWATPA
jgi:predicted nucleic acid-binding Zn ribbon protein